MFSMSYIKYTFTMIIRSLRFYLKCCCSIYHLFVLKERSALLKTGFLPPSPHVSFLGYPLPPPQERCLLWMVPDTKFHIDLLTTWQIHMRDTNGSFCTSVQKVNWEGILWPTTYLVTVSFFVVFHCYGALLAFSITNVNFCLFNFTLYKIS